MENKMHQVTKTIDRRSLSVPEFAQRHGISTATIWRRIAEGEITVFKTGHLTRILVEEEDRWLSERLSTADQQTRD
jgi:excisionase family DNA binding protein